MGQQKKHSVFNYQQRISLLIIYPQSALVLASRLRWALFPEQGSCAGWRNAESFICLGHGYSSFHISDFSLKNSPIWRRCVVPKQKQKKSSTPWTCLKIVGEREKNFFFFLLCAKVLFLKNIL